MPKAKTTTKRKVSKLFRAAANEQAYLKMGIFGFPGAGKTFTAAKIAVGLHKHIGSKNPILFFDTETGSSFVTHIFKDEKIKLQVAHRRDFMSMLEACEYAESMGAILIIDSITHVWDELQDAYMAKKKQDQLYFQDWRPLKKEWRRFTDWFINSECHVIMCARAGYEYEMGEGEKPGTKSLQKTGTKMRADSQMGFEPSLILEMELIKTYADSKAARGERGIINRAYVIKDRFNSLNGAIIDNPTFEDIQKHVDLLNIGGKHTGVDVAHDSTGMISDRDFSREERSRRRKIALDEVEGVFRSNIPGTSAPEKKAKADILQTVFGTRSWTKISDDWQSLPLEAVEGGVKLIEKECQKYLKAQTNASKKAKK